MSLFSERWVRMKWRFDRMENDWIFVTTRNDVDKKSIDDKLHNIFIGSISYSYKIKSLYILYIHLIRSINMKKQSRKPGKRRMRKTMKKLSTTNTQKSQIVRMFIEMLNVVKIYHWKTRSYAQHKATDELYERLNENIDKFVEILLGKDETRIKLVEKKMKAIDTTDKKDFKERIYRYRDFLTEMNIYFDEKRDSDLLSLRDEILGDINQFLYLMTFK